MGKSIKKTETPYLDNIAKKSKIEKQKRIISKFYLFLSTLMILATLVMIALNPDRYLNMVVVLLLAAVLLIALENTQLHKLKLKKPQNF